MSEKKCAHIYNLYLINNDYRVQLVHLDLICVSCMQHLRIDITNNCAYDIVKAVISGDYND
jgi:hypothetical protein